MRVFNQLTEAKLSTNVTLAVETEATCQRATTQWWSSLQLNGINNKNNDDHNNNNIINKAKYHVHSIAVALTILQEEQFKNNQMIRAKKEFREPEYSITYIPDHFTR